MTLDFARCQLTPFFLRLFIDGIKMRFIGTPTFRRCSTVEALDRLERPLPAMGGRPDRGGENSLGLGGREKGKEDGESQKRRTLLRITIMDCEACVLIAIR
jgi:hypothetical protein